MFALQLELHEYRIYIKNRIHLICQINDFVWRYPRSRLFLGL